jgi:exosome complex exonuclease RRP6
VKEEERDTIVVVGQARQKRKRTKAQPQNGAEKSNEPTADEAPSSSAHLKKEAEESNALEPESFDFSAVHNILDDNPDLEDGNRKKKRQKQQKKGLSFLSLSLFHFECGIYRSFLSQVEYSMGISLRLPRHTVN